MPTSRQQKRLEAQRKIIQHFEEKIPYFTDIFDERTFYISFACLTVFCIIAAIFLAYCCNVTIQDADELNKQREERKRLKKRKLAEKLLRKKLAKAGIDPNNMDPVKRAKLEKLLERITQEDTKKETDIEDIENEMNEQEQEQEENVNVNQNKNFDNKQENKHL
jgi:hypothetical protein